MKKIKDAFAPIALRTALLLSPLIFIIIVFVFSATGRYFKWPSTDDQRTTAIYIAVAFSLLPIITYLLNLFAQNKASLGVKVFGADVKVALFNLKPIPPRIKKSLTLSEFPLL